ncbi:MAG TPA: hypothetical protein VGC42_25275 [Kofleriaceae bacterium]
MKTWTRIAALAGGLITGGAAACSGGSHGAPPVDAGGEACNGIDDNGDGRIDEGCACAPFSVEVPFRVMSAVSLGNSWALTTTTDLQPSPGDRVPAGYARIDGRGTVLDHEDLLDGLVGPSPQPFAWDGHALTYVWTSDTDSHLAMIGPDATPIATGPSLGLAAQVLNGGAVLDALILATPAGFDIAAQVVGQLYPIGAVASTDAHGAPLPSTVKALPGGGPRGTYHLDLIAGQTMIVWSGHDVEQDPYWVSPLATLQRNMITRPYAVVSSGAEMLLFGEPGLQLQWVYDGTTATRVSLGVDAVGAAWTGDHYELAALAPDGVLEEVRLSRDHAVTATTPLSTVDGSAVYNSVVAADASHALFGRFYSVGGATHQVLTQVCL